MHKCDTSTGEVSDITEVSLNSKSFHCIHQYLQQYLNLQIYIYKFLA